MPRPIKAAPIKPVVLAGAGVSKDWDVIFRSGSPMFWNQDVKKDEQNFAKSLTSIADDVQYLPLRKDADYVIIETTKAKLRKNLPRWPVWLERQQPL